MPVLVLRLRQVDLHRQQVARLEAGRHAHQLREAARHQAGADQQHQRERDLDDHERAQQPPARMARRARERVHRVAQAGARRLDRGDEAEDQRDADRDRQREEQHAAVEAHVLHARQAAFGQRVHEADARPRDEQPERAADARQHEALREHLTHELPASGAERRAHRDLAAAAREPREDQVRHVGADDQQQEADRGRKSAAARDGRW